MYYEKHLKLLYFSVKILISKHNLRSLKDKDIYLEINGLYDKKINLYTIHDMRLF